MQIRRLTALLLAGLIAAMLPVSVGHAKAKRSTSRKSHNAQQVRWVCPPQYYYTANYEYTPSRSSYDSIGATRSQRPSNNLSEYPSNESIEQFRGPVFWNDQMY